MKKTLFLLLILATVSISHAQDQTTFVLVRHAEKASDGTKDPPLNEMGMKRATELASFLENQDITALYSTPFQRTRTTLKPLAEKTKLEMQAYDPFPADDWFGSLFEKHAGGTVVIVGHSNTIPAIANKLLGTEELAQFDESDYTNLLIVVATEAGNGKMLWLKF